MFSKIRLRHLLIAAMACLLIAWILDYNSLLNRVERTLEDSSELKQKYQKEQANSTMAASEIELAKRQQNIRIGTAFTENKCDEFHRLIDERDPTSFAKWSALLHADLIIRGKCTDEKISVAHKIYQKHLALLTTHQDHKKDPFAKLGEEYYNFFAHIKWRLAALYIKGQGVAPDLDMAQKLINDAAIMYGPFLFKIKHMKPFEPAIITEPNVWAMSDVGILENITFHETGPWAIPEQIRQKISWLTNIDAQGGKAIYDIGVNLLRGTNGYPKDPIMAYEWILSASQYHGYAPADYLRALLLRSQEYYNLRRSFPIFSNEFAIFSDNTRANRKSNSLLLRAAKAGNIEADKKLLALTKATDDYDNKDYDIYFWMLRIYQQNKQAISEESMSKARKNLKKYDQQYAENNVNNNVFSHNLDRLSDVPRSSIPLDSL